MTSQAARTVLRLVAVIVPRPAPTLAKVLLSKTVVLIVVVLVRGLARVAVKAALQFQDVLVALQPVLTHARTNVPPHVQEVAKVIVKENVPMVVLGAVNHPARVSVRANVGQPAPLLVLMTAKVGAKTDARLDVPLSVVEDAPSNVQANVLVVVKEHVQVLVRIVVIIAVPLVAIVMDVKAIVVLDATINVHRFVQIVVIIVANTIARHIA